MESDAKSPRAKVVPIKADNPLTAKQRAKLARLPAPVHSVQEKGKLRFSRALRNLFDNADDALFTLADKATTNDDQNLYFESMREVRIRRRELESRFADAIDNAFVDLVVKDRNRGQAAYAGNLSSAEGLSLVQDDELDELVAIDSMISKASGACGESLQYLSLRLDSLVPNKVYQKTNPLGPDVICNAFVSAARELNADIKAKLVLFKLFEEYVVSELPSIYEELNQTLIEHNVLPSLQRQKPGAGSSPSGQSPSETSPSAPAAPAGESGAQLGIVVLSVPQLLGALSQLQGQQTSGWTASDQASVASVQMDIGEILIQSLQQQHGAGSLDQSQMETINLVKMLFEFILDDRSLAEPMKALIGRLQIPILKVALLDDTFFKRNGHPARRLLNEMATACLGWQENFKDNSPEGLKDPLYRKINSTVQYLLAEFETDISIFNEVLADFVSFVDKERKRASLLEQRTIDAEDGKARAEAARQKVNGALQAAVAGKPVPASVQTMLDQAWTNVLFLICLKQGPGSEEWEQALQTARDLTWSVTAEVNPESRPVLLGMIPHLVKRLREGLERISYNPFEMNQLLNQLEKLHLARLQGTSLQDLKDMEAEDPKTAQPEAACRHSSTAGGQEAGSSDAASASTDADPGYLARIDKLTQGTWFEITEGNGRTYRCRLAAIIKPAGKYIFVNRSGMKVAEKTRESLALAMQEQKLKALDDSMLFDRALESVISGSRRPR